MTWGRNSTSRGIFNAKLAEARTTAKASPRSSRSANRSSPADEEIFAGADREGVPQEIARPAARAPEVVAEARLREGAALPEKVRRRGHPAKGPEDPRGPGEV